MIDIRKKCQSHLWLLTGTGEGYIFAKSLLKEGWKITVSVVSDRASIPYEKLNIEKILDLFSGVGSLGIEALSRGAAHLTAVENNSSVFKILLNNITHICKDDDVELYRKSTEHFLNLNTKKFDIIFVDPPYGEYDFSTIKESVSKILNLNGILCVEMKKTEIEETSNNIRIKYYGNTQVIFWHLT